MVDAVSDPIAAGREAARRRAWDEAYVLLSSADGTLAAEDLERLADAAFWSNRLDEALSSENGRSGRISTRAKA